MAGIIAYPRNADAVASGGAAAFVQAASADYLGADEAGWPQNSGGQFRRLAVLIGKLAAFLLILGCLLYPGLAIGLSVYMRVL